MEKESINLEKIRNMSTFKSPEILISKSAKDLFTKISDLNNLKEIMPSKIEGFISTESTCSFKMKGIPKVSLEILEKIEFSKISLASMDSQIPFTLECLIIENGKQCKVKLEINAKLNMMMKMMVEKPLTNFLEELALKMRNF